MKNARKKVIRELLSITNVIYLFFCFMMICVFAISIVGIFIVDEIKIMFFVNWISVVVAASITRYMATMFVFKRNDMTAVSMGELLSYYPVTRAEVLSEKRKIMYRLGVGLGILTGGMLLLSISSFSFLKLFIFLSGSLIPPIVGVVFSQVEKKRDKK